LTCFTEKKYLGGVAGFCSGLRMLAWKERNQADQTSRTSSGLTRLPPPPVTFGNHGQPDFTTSSPHKEIHHANQ
jgi:hypothetical protein